MNEVKVFSHPELGDVRTTMIDGEPWFVGKDVASALGYTNSRKALADHVDEEDKNTVTNRYAIGLKGGNDSLPPGLQRKALADHAVDVLGYQNGSRDVNGYVNEEDKGVVKRNTPGGTQQMTIINESGLYSLILSSKLPSARKFKRWVTSEVLPAIRRTGSFDAAGKHGVITKEDCLRAAEALTKCTGERLPYVAAVLRQAGFSVPASVGVQRPALPAVALPEARGTCAGEADRERMQYETLLRYPQVIHDYPDLMRKYPEIAAVAARQEELKEPKDTVEEPPRKGNREGYGPWFNFRKLRRELEARGMSQNELSRRSGIHPRTLRKYLDGEHRPAAANRGAICDALGVKHGYFDK